MTSETMDDAYKKAAIKSYRDDAAMLDTAKIVDLEIEK